MTLMKIHTTHWNMPTELKTSRHKLLKIALLLTIIFRNTLRSYRTWRMRFQILKLEFITNHCCLQFLKKWEQRLELKHLKCYKKLCLLILSKKLVYANRFLILITKWYWVFKKLIWWEGNFSNCLIKKARMQFQLSQKYNNLNSKKQKLKNWRFNLKSSNRSIQIYLVEEMTLEKNGVKPQSSLQV